MHKTFRPSFNSVPSCLLRLASERECVTVRGRTSSRTDCFSRTWQPMEDGHLFGHWLELWKIQYSAELLLQGIHNTESCRSFVGASSGSTGSLCSVSDRSPRQRFWMAVI